MWNGNKPDRVVYAEDYFNSKWYTENGLKIVPQNINFSGLVESACKRHTSITGWGRSPREDMKIHSSIPAWEIPGTDEPGGF